MSRKLTGLTIQGILLLHTDLTRIPVIFSFYRLAAVLTIDPVICRTGTYLGRRKPQLWASLLWKPPLRQPFSE